MGRTLRAFGFLSLLSISFCIHATAQKVPGEKLPSTTVAKDEPSPTARLVAAVSGSVTSIDSTGDRTVENIADYSVTLGIGKMEDDSAFRVLCINGGKPLLTFVQSLIENLSLAGKVSNPACTGTDNASDALALQLHLHREGGSSLFQESPLLLTPALEQPDDDLQVFDGPPPAATDNDKVQIPDSPAVAESTEPLKLNSVRTQTSHASMSFPKGWTPVELPKPIHSDSPFATFDVSMTFEDSKLVTEQKLVIKKDKVEAPERAAFDKWRQESQMAQAETSIQLESTIYFPNSAFNGKTDAEKNAIELMQKASAAIEKKDFAAAEEFLKQSQAADPGHELLHEAKGDLAKARGHYDEAVKEYREELRAFPNALLEMQTLAFCQRDMGRMDDAVATLQAWMVADLDNPFPAIDLMNLYHDMHRDDLAVGVGDQAMNTLHADALRSVQFLLAYGHEQMLAGQADRAKGVLENVLNVSTDSWNVNNAAYFLSEKGVSLDRAEEILRESLKQYDVDDSDDAAGGGGTVSGDKNLLPSSWDTLGWILFQKKEIKDAEGYIRAAWRNHQDPAIGLHLAEVFLAQDKPQEALDTCKLAIASIPEKDLANAAGDPDVITIRQTIERLEKEGRKSTIKDPKAALEELRTVDAGPAGKFHGEAEYGLNYTSSTVAGFPKDFKNLEEMMDFSAIKLPADFFPPGSHATLTRDAKLKCKSTCTLTFLP